MTMNHARPLRLAARYWPVVALAGLCLTPADAFAAEEGDLSKRAFDLLLAGEEEDAEAPKPAPEKPAEKPADNQNPPKAADGADGAKPANDAAKPAAGEGQPKPAPAAGAATGERPAANAQNTGDATTAAADTPKTPWPSKTPGSTPGTPGAGTPGGARPVKYKKVK